MVVMQDSPNAHNMRLCHPPQELNALVHTHTLLYLFKRCCSRHECSQASDFLDAETTAEAVLPWAGPIWRGFHTNPVGHCSRQWCDQVLATTMAAIDRLPEHLSRHLLEHLGTDMCFPKSLAPLLQRCPDSAFVKELSSYITTAKNCGRLDLHLYAERHPDESGDQALTCTAAAWALQILPQIAHVTLWLYDSAQLHAQGSGTAFERKSSTASVWQPLEHLLSLFSHRVNEVGICLVRWSGPAATSKTLAPLLQRCTEAAAVSLDAELCCSFGNDSCDPQSSIQQLLHVATALPKLRALSLEVAVQTQLTATTCSGRACQRLQLNSAHSPHVVQHKQCCAQLAQQVLACKQAQQARTVELLNGEANDVAMLKSGCEQMAALQHVMVTLRSNQVMLKASQDDALVDFLTGRGVKCHVHRPCSCGKDYKKHSKYDPT